MTRSPPLSQGLFMWLVAKAKAKNNDSGESGESSPSQQVIDQMQEWTDKRVKESEAWAKRRLAESEQRISVLEKRVSTVEAKYRAALLLIRRLLQRHPESSDAIADDVRGDL